MTDAIIRLEEDWYEHLTRNQPELEYQISLIDGELAQIFAINYHQTNTQKRIQCGLLLIEQIEQQVLEEAKYQAEKEMEERDE